MSDVNKCRCNHHQQSHVGVQCSGRYVLEGGATERCDCTEFVEMTDAQAELTRLVESLMSA